MASVGGNPRNNNYGSWTICLDVLPQEPVVYSIGIGCDVSFDIAMARNYNAHARCLDPTVSAQRFDVCSRQAGPLEASVRNRLTFIQMGLGPTDGNIPFYKSFNPKIASLISTPARGYNRTPHMVVPVKPIRNIMANIGDASIDILKVDCEGCEFLTFTYEMMVGVLGDHTTAPSQIAIEFHDRIFPKASRASVIDVLKTFGYTIAHSSKTDEVLFARHC